MIGAVGAPTPEGTGIPDVFSNAADETPDTGGPRVLKLGVVEAPNPALPGPKA